MQFFMTLSILVLTLTSSAKSPGMLAKVEKIESRPNTHENGRFQVIVKDREGHHFTIDATGFMNSAISPEQFGKKCVRVPKLELGQEIEFLLPKDGDRFITCFNAAETKYFFNLVPPSK